MRKRGIWIILIIALLLAGGGYVAYTRFFAVAEEPQAPTLQTATVTQGDIVITADGSGELVPATELGLTFRTSGVLDEVPVGIGDQVHKGDLLAQLETDDLERAVAEADVTLQSAQADLADTQEGPSEAELANARAALRNAQVGLELAQQTYENTSYSSLDAAADSAKVQFDWWVGTYQAQNAKYEAGQLSQADHDWAMAAMIAADGQWQAAVNQALIEGVQAKNGVDQAKNSLYQASESLQLLESGPLTNTVLRAMLTVDQALLARQQAAANLEAAQLYAPFDGTVMSVDATVGEQAGIDTSILTLANLQEPLVRFWVEEADLSSVVVGNPVSIVFEALPDSTFTGEVIRVDPMLATVGNTSAVQAWASLDSISQTNLLSGMTASVEVTAAQARNALLVPTEALHEVSPGQYAVSVVKSDGTLEMRPVTVGLQDAINVEILGGLELGEIVSIE